jgi:phosphatidate phosphatase APP1
VIYSNQTSLQSLHTASPLASTMRNNRSRPTSQHANPPAALARLDPLVGRKIFNCIVDDTVLVAGVKKSTRNGIRQWVKNGQIRLFVPLHGMQMDRGNGRTGNIIAADTFI